MKPKFWNRSEKCRKIINWIQFRNIAAAQCVYRLVTTTLFKLSSDTVHSLHATCLLETTYTKFYTEIGKKNVVAKKPFVSRFYNIYGRLLSIYSVNLESLAQYSRYFFFLYILHTFWLSRWNLSTAVCLLKFFFLLRFAFLDFFLFAFFFGFRDSECVCVLWVCSSYLPWWLAPDCWSETMHANHFVLNQLMTFAAWMRPLIVIHHRPKWIVRVVRCLCVPWLMNDRRFRFVLDGFLFGMVKLRCCRLNGFRLCMCLCVIGALCNCVCKCTYKSSVIVNLDDCCCCCWFFRKFSSICFQFAIHMIQRIRECVCVCTRFWDRIYK